MFHSNVNIICIFTKISGSTINVKTKNGSWLYSRVVCIYNIIIHVDQVYFKCKEVWGLGLRPNIKVRYLVLAK